NDEFNNVRLRTFNGDHLTLPGASPAITLRPHQKAGVWRILQSPNTLLAHVVGAGKTYTQVAAGMELKRLGLARTNVRRSEPHAGAVLVGTPQPLSGRQYPGRHQGGFRVKQTPRVDEPHRHRQ